MTGLPHRRARRRARLLTAALVPLLAATACSGGHETAARPALGACDLVDARALAAATGWPLPERGVQTSQDRDGLQLSSCAIEPARTVTDPTEGGLANVEVSPTGVSRAQLDSLAVATGNAVADPLGGDDLDALAARWLLGSDLDEARRLYGEDPVRLQLPRELDRDGATAFTVARHGVAARVAGGRFARLSRGGEGVDERVLADVVTDAVRRLEGDAR